MTTKKYIISNEGCTITYNGNTKEIAINAEGLLEFLKADNLRFIEVTFFADNFNEPERFEFSNYNSSIKEI